MPAEKRNQVFNRYANIQLAPYTSLATLRPLERPWAPIDTAVLIPYEAFLPKMQVELAPGVPKLKAPRPPVARTRVRSFAHRQVMLDVQGPIRPLRPGLGRDPHRSRRPTATKARGGCRPEDGSGGARSRTSTACWWSGWRSPKSPAPQGLGWCVTIHDSDRGLPSSARCPARAVRSVRVGWRKPATARPWCTGGPPCPPLARAATEGRPYTDLLSGVSAAAEPAGRRACLPGRC